MHAQAWVPVARSWGHCIDGIKVARLRLLSFGWCQHPGSSGASGWRNRRYRPVLLGLCSPAPLNEAPDAQGGDAAYPVSGRAGVAEAPGAGRGGGDGAVFNINPKPQRCRKRNAGPKDSRAESEEEGSAVRARAGEEGQGQSTAGRQRIQGRRGWVLVALAVGMTPPRILSESLLGVQIVDGGYMQGLLYNVGRGGRRHHRRTNKKVIL